MSLISLTIKQDTREVERMLKHFDRGAHKVITRALNKTIKPVEVLAVRAMAKDLRITQKNVRQAVKLHRATWSNRRAVIHVTGRRLPIMDIGARQTRRGVTYKGRGGGRKLIPGSFITTMLSGHQGVFKRMGKSRLPILELHGASIPHVFIQTHLQNALDRKAAEGWDKNIKHELKWFIKNA